MSADCRPRAESDTSLSLPWQSVLLCELGLRLGRFVFPGALRCGRALWLWGRSLKEDSSVGRCGSCSTLSIISPGPDCGPDVRHQVLGAPVLLVGGSGPYGGAALAWVRWGHIHSSPTGMLCRLECGGPGAHRGCGILSDLRAGQVHSLLCIFPHVCVWAPGGRFGDQRQTCGALTPNFPG